jgi:hypothetical protein
MRNVHDRLHPEQAPPDQRWRSHALDAANVESATIASGSGDEMLLGAGEDGLLPP